MGWLVFFRVNPADDQFFDQALRCALTLMMTGVVCVPPEDALDKKMDTCRASAEVLVELCHTFEATGVHIGGA